MASEICCVISGSFTKAKLEIDRARECFEDYGIKVLSPDRGRLFYSEPGVHWSRGAYPLLTERSISEIAAKENHIKAITRANFLYVCAPEGYVGVHVGMEIGWTLGRRKPIYVDQVIERRFFDDTPWGPRILEMIEVKSPEEVVKMWKETHRSLVGLWLPPGYVSQS